MRHSNPIVQFALQHGEKVLCGAAAAWLATVGVSFAQQPDVLDRVDEIQQSWKFVQHYMNTAEPEPLLVTDRRGQLREQLEPEAVPVALGFPAWVMHRRPQFIYEVIEPDIPRLVFSHAPSKVLAVEVERGKATVRWKAGDCSLTLIPAYFLERRVENGPWTRVAELDARQESYDDTSVRPRTSYAYRVVSTVMLNAEDEIVQAHEATEFPKDLERTEGKESEEVVTPKNTILVLNTVTPGDELRRRKGAAQVYVYRWNQETREFDHKLFLVREGRKIGKGVFATGARLERVWTERRGVGNAQRPIGMIEFRRPGEPLERANDRTPFRH